MRGDSVKCCVKGGRILVEDQVWEEWDASKNRGLRNVERLNWGVSCGLKGFSFRIRRRRRVKLKYVCELSNKSFKNSKSRID